MASLMGATSSASAATISIVGNTNGSLATATETSSFNAQTNTFTFTLLNTSPFNARITGVGFDLAAGDFAMGSSGLNGFSGANVGNFAFSDAALGNVNQFSDVVLDFGWITGNNFTGGSPNNGIAPGASLVFSVSGSPFAGRTDEQIAGSIFVRFQRVGPNGDWSDVGVQTFNQQEVPRAPVPEPTSLALLGSGLIAAARSLKRRRT